MSPNRDAPTEDGRQGDGEKERVGSKKGRECSHADVGVRLSLQGKPELVIGSHRLIGKVLEPAAAAVFCYVGAAAAAGAVLRRMSPSEQCCFPHAARLRYMRVRTRWRASSSRW